MTDKDHLFLERHEIRALVEQLRAVPWLVRELVIVVTRQTSYAPTAGRGRSSDTDAPIPFHDKASDIAHDLTGTLRAWVEYTCIERQLDWPGEQRATGYARWLDRHVMDLALTEEAPIAADEITNACKHVYPIIDRPKERTYIGPCQSTTPGTECRGVFCDRTDREFTCRTCNIVIDVPALHATTEAKKQEAVRDTLATAREISELIEDTYGWKIPKRRIHYLAERGLIAPRPSADGHTRYKLSEVLDANARTRKHA